MLYLTFFSRMPPQRFYSFLSEVIPSELTVQFIVCVFDDNILFIPAHTGIAFTAAEEVPTAAQFRHLESAGESSSPAMALSRSLSLTCMSGLRRFCPCSRAQCVFNSRQLSNFPTKKPSAVPSLVFALLSHHITCNCLLTVVFSSETHRLADA